MIFTVTILRNKKIPPGQTGYFAGKEKSLNMLYDAFSCLH